MKPTTNFAAVLVISLSLAGCATLEEDRAQRDTHMQLMHDDPEYRAAYVAEQQIQLGKALLLLEMSNAMRPVPIPAQAASLGFRCSTFGNITTCN